MGTENGSIDVHGPFFVVLTLANHIHAYSAVLHQFAIFRFCITELVRDASLCSKSQKIDRIFLVTS